MCACSQDTVEGLVEEDPKVHRDMNLSFYQLQMPDANGRRNLF